MEEVSWGQIFASIPVPATADLIVVEYFPGGTPFVKLRIISAVERSTCTVDKARGGGIWGVTVLGGDSRVRGNERN